MQICLPLYKGGAGLSGINWVTWYKEDSIGVITINNTPVNTIGTKQLKEMVSCLDEVYH